MKTVINIKTDKEVKEGAQRAAKEIGVPLSTVVNAFLKEFVRERQVTFSAEPRLRPEVARLLREASADYRRRKNLSPVFDNVEDAIRWLNA